MPRIRTIKPQLFDDEKLSTVSVHARYTFMGLLVQSDDYGVVKGHPGWLRTRIYPYDPCSTEEVAEWLGQLEALGVIIPFEANQEKFYYIKNFLRHQKINRPSEARNPEPPEEIIEGSRSAQGVLSDGSMQEKEKEKDKEKDEEEEGDSKGKQKPASSKPFYKGKPQKEPQIIIPLADGQSFSVTRDFITKLQHKYPNREIESELNEMTRTYSSNPSFRPKKDQVLVNIENWFAR